MPFHMLLADPDSRKFPFSLLEDMPEAFHIDGGESEEEIADLFFAASGLDRSPLRFEWDDAGNCNILVWGDQRFALSFSDNESGNDKTVRALDAIHASTHEVRLVTPSLDTGSFSFIVLPRREWEILSTQHGRVDEWFVPIRHFPDLFHTPLNVLMALGNIEA